MLKTSLIILSFIFACNFLQAQKSSLNLGTKVPLNYTLGFEQQLYPDLSLNIQAGILTKPYDQAIVEIMKTLGAEKALANTIGEAFTIGYNIQPSVKYYFGNYYLGLSYAYYSLWAKDVSRESIEDYYGVPLPFRPLNPNTFNMNSRLHNAGMYFGRSFSLDSPNWSLDLELGVHKTISSYNELHANYGELTTINNLIDEELDEVYKQYGYLASLNIFIVYSF
jgi:hypothetical protein